MWGPKYGTDFGYGTDERGVGLTYMYHSLDFDKLRNERTDKPGSIVIDTYKDPSGATVYDMEEVNALIKDADARLKEYKETHEGWI
jgi:hypothetical protein